MQSIVLGLALVCLSLVSFGCTKKSHDFSKDNASQSQGDNNNSGSGNGSGSVNPLPEPESPNKPVDDAGSVDLRSCVNDLCNGAKSFVYPVLNTTGKANGRALAFCQGNWWVDTRGNSYASGCDTDWVVTNATSSGQLENFNSRLPEVPEQGCVNASCSGSNSLVYPVINAEGRSNKRNVAYCQGSFTVNVEGSAWASSCSTGWKVYPF